MTHENTAYLVFETGGTKLVAGVAGADRRIVETAVLRRGENDVAETSLSRLIDAGHRLRREHEAGGRRFAAVGFGFGGVVRRSAREAYRCLHEAGWEEIRVAERIEQEFGLPAAVENDCKLAALAEAHFGAGRGARTVFYITIGTGVGGGIVRDGRIQQLSDLGEAEIGHIVVAPDGPPCWCGGRGCVESVCSGPGMSQLADWMARDDIGAAATSPVRRTLGSSGSVTSKELIEGWRTGDPFAAQVVEKSASYLAQAIAAAINLTAPEIFIAGGGVGSTNGDYLALVEKKVSPLVVVYFRGRYRMIPCGLGEDAVSQGAAILAAQI